MRAQLLAQGKQADPLLRRAKLWVLARVYAGMWHVMYDVVEWLSLQILPSTATDEDYVVDHGKTYAVNRLPATIASGTLRITGDDDTVIASGTQFVREDGVSYVSTSAGTIGVVTSGYVDVPAEAEEAGAAGNMDTGTVLSLASPVSGVDYVARLTGFDDGTDLEEIEELRTRILERTTLQPQGGARDDYVLWSREINGVFRVLVVPLGRGDGTVDVYFLHEEGTGIGIPTSGQISELQSHLDDVAPVEASVLARAPTTQGVDLTFVGIVPDTSEVRTAIETELDALFLARALTGQNIHLSDFYAAISEAAGLEGFELVDPGGFSADVGEVLVRGTITWPS